MPRTLSKLIGEIEEIHKKLEYEFEEYAGIGDDAVELLGEALDALVEINDELDQDMEE